jgi:hypothetical protein
MTAKVRVKRCPKCGYHTLRAYAQYHVCRPGDKFEHRVLTAQERAAMGKR